MTMWSAASKRWFESPERLFRQAPGWRLARGHVIQGNHPMSAHLAHQSRVDSKLRMLETIELVLTDQLRGIRRQHLNLDIVEPQRAARFGGASIVPDVVIERSLPPLLKPSAGNKHDIRVLETL